MKRDEKGIISLHEFIGYGGFAQYVYFNTSTSPIVSSILVYIEYKDSFISNK